MKKMKEMGWAIKDAGRKYGRLALVAGLVLGAGMASAALPGGAPPGSLDGFELATIGENVAPVIGEVVTALGVVFGLLFSIVVIRFSWKYIRGAFGR